VTTTTEETAPAETARPDVEELLKRHGRWGCPRTVYDLLEEHPGWNPEVLLGSRHHDVVAEAADAAMTLLGGEYDAVWIEAQRALTASNQNAHGRLDAYLQRDTVTAVRAPVALAPQQPAPAAGTEPDDDEPLGKLNPAAEKAMADFLADHEAEDARTAAIHDAEPPDPDDDGPGDDDPDEELPAAAQAPPQPYTPGLLVTGQVPAADPAATAVMPAAGELTQILPAPHDGPDGD
jgi:hypothetical protein